MSHEVWSAPEKNRLYIKFGVMDRKNYVEFEKRLIQEIKNLKKGFTCIADLRNFRADCSALVPQDIKRFKYIRISLSRAGMCEMVQVIDPQICLATNLMQDDELENTTPFVNTIEKAERLLDSQ